jgi:hypothetical protein
MSKVIEEARKALLECDEDEEPLVKPSGRTPGFQYMSVCPAILEEDQ